MTFADTAATYLADPTPAHFAALRDDVRAAGNFDPLVEFSRRARVLLAAGDAAEAAAGLLALMPGVFLSPSAHVLLAEAHEQRGDDAGVVRERAFAGAALAGILGTGDGSEGRPWSVLLIADEYDVLSSRGKVSRRQELIVTDDRRLDKHECTDGTEVWFALLGA